MQSCPQYIGYVAICYSVFSHDVTAYIDFIRRHAGGVKTQHGGHRCGTIELNITGRLPLTGNLKPLVPSLFTHDQTKTFNLRENLMST